MATSGAAASPNMGYHTSPTLAFLMTMFNVRLGWWLRNPRWPEVWADQRTGLSLRELLSELLGMTTDDRAWVYLSDGGHFENLGVYELVRRRCRFIIACDAGQDGDGHVRGSRQRSSRSAAPTSAWTSRSISAKLAPDGGRRSRLALRDRHHPLRPAQDPAAKRPARCSTSRAR